MLRTNPHAWLWRAKATLRRWWSSGSTRLRLRRRLMLTALPVALALLALAAMLATVLLTGNRVVEDYGRHDTTALHRDLDILSRFNILERYKLPFAQGDLSVLEGRLSDAETSFRASLSKRETCPARINLELVVETQGDLAAARGDINNAEQRYISALDVVRGAPENCFSGNDDPDPDRRHIRQDAEPRLLAKIDSLHQRRNPPASNSSAAPAPQPAPADASASLAPTTLPAPPPDASGPPPTAAPTPPPPNSGGPNTRPVFGPDGGPRDTAGGGSEALNDVDPDRLPTGGAVQKPGHKLGVGTSDPLDALQQALQDSDSTGGNRE